MYGIGRLSWLMLGDVAEIITGKNKLIWRKEDLDAVERELMPTYFNGVKWIIHLREDVSLHEREIEDYIRETYHGNISIYVNNRKVELISSNGILLFNDGVNEVYFVPRLFSGIIVKGVFSIGRDYYLEKLLIKQMMLGYE